MLFQCISDVSLKLLCSCWVQIMIRKCSKVHVDLGLHYFTKALRFAPHNYFPCDQTTMIWLKIVENNASLKFIPTCRCVLKLLETTSQKENFFKISNSVSSQFINFYYNKSSIVQQRHFQSCLLQICCWWERVNIYSHKQQTCTMML